MLVMSFFLFGCKEDFSVQVYNRTSSIVFIINERGDGSGLGTGFFIDENTIVSNDHVTRDSTNLYVKVKSSNKKYEAYVESSSKEADISIIRIKDWKEFDKEVRWNRLEFTDTFKVRAGQEVWTYGHPGGLDYTVSRGIISSVKEVIDSSPQSFIQFDAKAYQGNSGGPLFNDDGKVIGVVSRLLAQTGGSYGFAIDGNLVQKVIEDLLKKKEVYWLKLGVSITEDEEGNIVVTKVNERSIAENIGIQEKDIFYTVHTSNTEWNGERIITPRDLVRSLTYIKENEEFKITVIRESRKRVLIFKPKE